MFTNAAVGGALGAAFAGVLVLQLNPQVPLDPRVLGPLYLRLLAFYGTHLTVAFYLLIVIRQLLSREVLSPGWLSVRLLAWMGTVLAGGAAVLMWSNLRGLRLVLTAEAAQRMAAGATATSICALLLLLIAAVHYSFGRRGSRTTGALLALTTACTVALPIVARGWGQPRPAPPVPPPHNLLATAPPAARGRLILVLLDGASLEYIAPATAAGRLPHFGRLLDAGASMHLSVFHPTQPATVWTAVATGKYPAQNGVRSAAAFSFGADPERLDVLPDGGFAYAMVRFGVIDQHEQDASALRARPLWSILSAFGIRVGIVGWPLSDPVQPVNGYIVSDRAHRAGGLPLVLEDPRVIYPVDAFTSTPAPAMPAAALDGWVADATDEASAATGAAVASAERGLLPRDVWYRRVASALEGPAPPQLTAVRYQGIDVAGHHYLRYAMPRAFGDVSEAERREHGQVLDRQYARVDEELGAILDGLDAEDVLMVVSGFGMEPVGLLKRWLARALGEPDLTGTHERAPDGFLLAYGGPVQAGRLPVGSVVDVAPTILYLLGLPVGRDMDGYARTDLFAKRFTAERPITFIPSYD
jgi:hypothetical protein